MSVGRTFGTNAAAAYLGVHRDTLLRAYRAGKIKGVRDTLRPGSPIRFWKEDLDGYAAAKLVSNLD